ncbi:MAG: cupredoxin domain-containing protein [Ilumatobacteraceae bacterium]
MTATSGGTSRRARRYLQRRAQIRNRVIGAIGAAVVVVAIVVVVVVTGGGDDKPVPPPFVGSTLNLVLGEYFIRGDLTAPAGEVRLHAFNQGGITHNVGIRGGRISSEIQPGRDTTVDIGNLAPGEYELYCDVPDHAQHGMVAKLIISAAAPTTTVATATT